MKILNIGCGTNKITGAINVDINPAVEPDMTFDMTQGWPFEDQSIDRIYMFHVIEHVMGSFRWRLLYECNRVLVVGGQLLLSYPEFSKCYANWKNNYKGLKNFWELCIFGRGLTEYDFHRAIMDTESVVKELISAGFAIKKVFPEPNEDYNTVVYAIKDQSNGYEDSLRRLYGRHD